MTQSTIGDMGRSLNRIRMKHIYNSLQGVSLNKDLLSKLKELPVTVRVNGLATIAAQLNASSETKGEFVCDLLAEWLLIVCPVLPWKKPGDGALQGAVLRSTLLQRCMQSSHLEYETAQKEALLFLEQAKLIAAALSPED